MLEEEYDFFSEFGEEVVNAVMEERIFIGEAPYIKGSSLIYIDMNRSEEFEFATGTTSNSSVDSGDHYCLDLSKSDGKDSPVLYSVHGKEEWKFKLYAESFLEF
ncbi:hypothetical protein KYB31_09555 [Clostridium felsineum]|uniref:hypothetical protein n=1 Tax=Clostridium felsineum TaxID=36839 RepID=UPI00214DCE2D|nr:hypothetical protein [Clostridium felsineum]MCR3759234.1 hypothetical protein [Clostridium felsineum]